MCLKFLIALALAFLAWTADAQVIGGGGTSGGAAGVVNIPIGANLRTYPWRNNTAYQLGAGTYTVTPSILNSNLIAGNQFTGWFWGNLTNVTLLGVPGKTIIDGSGSLGELHYASNCFGLYYYGLIFKAYTNHNFMELPRYGEAASVLWSSVNIYQCGFVRFENCGWQGSTDHGLQDKGSENSGFVASSELSTNRCSVINCWADDIGGWRTNGTVGYIAKDGTAFVGINGWMLRNITVTRSLRAFEPYDDSTGGRVFLGTTIEGCTIRDVADSAILFAGSTNGHYVSILFNDIENGAWNWRGTNFSPTSTMEHPGYGIMLNGGRGGRVIGNRVAGTFYAGAFIGNADSFCDDFEFSLNTIANIDSGNQDFGTGLWVGTLGTAASDASSVRRLKCQGNRFINCKLRGIYAGRGRDNVFEGNIFMDAGAYANVGPLFASMVVGESGVTGITNCYVRNNTFVSSFGWVAYALAIENNCVNVINENNTFAGYVANGGITNRSGIQVKTLGIPLSGSATFDLPSIAANSQYQTNFSLAGATTNTLFEINFPLTALQGVASNLVARGWGSNGTCYAIFRNPTGAAVDPPSHTYEAVGRDYRISGQ